MLPVEALVAARQTVLSALQHLTSLAPPSCSSTPSSLICAASSSTSGSTSQIITPLPTGLPETLLSLLSPLRHTVTSLSLALKPPLTPLAITAQSPKLAHTYDQCVACVLAASSGRAESVLVQIWAEGAREIGESLVRYLDVLERELEDDTPQPSKSSILEATRLSGQKLGRPERAPAAESLGLPENAYVLRTGEVWDAVDRLSNTLPQSEVEAVAHRWEEQRALMKDAWEEFKEALDEAAYEESDEIDGGSNGLGELGGEEDELGELLKGLGRRMSGAERARAEAAKSLLGLHQVLHASILKFLSSLHTSPETSFRPLLAASTSLLAAFDSTISAMYPEQDEAAIEAGLQELAVRSRNLCGCVRDRGGSSQFRTFLDRWDARLDSETDNWHSHKLSLSSMQTALSEV